ncbi:MAG TPA: hypothetical protein PK990_08615 [Salinivirgaceae bacterium]|nr:hypothetical protein [Salinivirgaceae bacterium]
MKKILILSIIAFVLSSVSVKSQNQLGKADDLARISLTPIVPDELEHIPPYARKLLTNKLGNVAAKNGLGGSATNPRFVITANVDILTKDITPTAPPKTAVTLSVTFYIADVVAQQVFASTQMEVKGVGNNDEKAYTSALDKIAPQSPQLRAMIDQGKNKIVEYYNSQCDFILKDAQAKADMKQYEMGLYILSTVPSICKECYDKAVTLIPAMYQQYADYKCMEDLSQARAYWGKKDYDNALAFIAQILPDSKCYDDATVLYKKIEQERCNEALGGAKGAWAAFDSEKAAEFLSKISTSCECYPEAEKLQAEIRAKLKEDQKREWDQMVKREDREFALKEKKLANEQELNKARIEAATQIATLAIQNNAYAWGYYNNLMWIFGY